MLKETRTVLFIIGSGRSGSTLLDMVLGTHNNMTTTGEIMDLNYHLQINQKCTCEKRISECNFWRRITKDLKNIRLNLKWFGLVRYIVSIINLIFIKFHILRYNIINDKGLEDNFTTIYQRIFDISNSRIIVDSSKSVLRAFYLYWMKNNHFNIKILYLIKDGRSYIYSRSIKSKQVSFKKSKNEWIKQNILSFFIFKTFKIEDRILIRYEDFAKKPHKIVKKICNFIGENYQFKMLKFRNEIHHNIGGNTMRFKSNGIHRPNEEWRKDYGFHYKIKYKGIFKHINQLFGYH